MENIEYTHEVDNQTWEVRVYYTAVPYSSGTYLDPPEGGYSEIEQIKVQSVTTIKEDGITTVYRRDLSEKDAKELDSVFDNIVENDSSLQESIQETVDEHCNDPYDHHDIYDD